MKKRLTTLLMILTLLTAILAFTGCPAIEDTPPTLSFSLASNWAGNENEEVFIKTTDNNVEILSYDKGGTEWAWAARTITETDTLALASFRYVKFTLRMDAEQGASTLMFKLEGINNAAIETRIFKVTDESETFVWDLGEFDVKNALRVLVFAAPGQATGVGRIYLEGIEISTSKFLGKSVNQVVVPQPNTFVSGETFNANDAWYNRDFHPETDDLVMKATTKEGTTTVEYNKPDTWFFLFNGVANVGDFNKITFDIEGKAGSTFLFKVEADVLGVKSGVEKTAVLTEGVNTVVLDYSSMTEEQRDNVNLVLIVPETNEGASRGSFKITKTEFSYEATAVVDTNTYVEGKEFNATQYWVDGGDSVYTFENNVITYNKTAHSWANINTKVANIGSFDYVVLKVTGTAGKTLMFKTEGGAIKEKSVTLTGYLQYVVLDMSEVDETARGNNNKLVIFAEPGIDAASGSFTMNGVYYTNWAPNVYESGETLAVSNWYDNDGNIFTQSQIEDGLQVTYNKPAGSHWAFFGAVINGVFDFEYLNIKITGEVGKTAKFKVEGNGQSTSEVDVVFDGTEQVVVIDMSAIPAATRAGFDKIVMFAAPNEELVTGTFTINQCEFSHTKATPTVLPQVAEICNNDRIFIANGEWRDNGDSVYTLTKDGNKTIVSYAKESQEYPAAKMLVKNGTADIDAFDYVQFVVKGTANKTAIFKPFDRVERVVTFTGEQQTFTVDLTGVTNVDFTNEVPMIIMAEGGQMNVSGSFEIIDVAFMKTSLTHGLETVGTDISTAWFANAPAIESDAFVVDNAARKVTYAATKTNMWSDFRVFISGNTLAYNTLELSFTGTINTKILVKIVYIDGSSNESAMTTLTGEAQALAMTVNAKQIREIYIMCPNEPAVAGEITFTGIVMQQITA